MSFSEHMYRKFLVNIPYVHYNQGKYTAKYITDSQPELG